ncbi:VWA domain-containing protein [Methanolobus sp. ZRKC3]|uniref:VWA domain-containing protein n=1 Tax=Methanolobus sp. ZRKC3 TaxID=3125786 RepID=UPI00324389F1
MSSEEIAMRLRRNLLRNYGIKVMHIGVPVLGMRIPRVSVSEFSRHDTDTFYDVLHSNIAQLRPSEISTVYVIADTDHVQIDPAAFFKPFWDGAEDPAPTFMETGESAFSDLLPDESDSEVLVDDDSMPAMDEPVESSSGEDIVHQETTPLKSDSAFMEVSSVIDEECETPDVELDSSRIESGSDVLVELTPSEYVVECKDDLPIVTPEDTRTADSGKVHKELQDDRVVGKILNEFAKNSQKKRLASGRLKSGRRAEVLTKSKRGRYVRYRMPGEKITDIAIAPTVRAAAFHAKDGKIEIRKSDIREKVRRRRISSLINIVFDTSGSMDEQEKVQITTSVVIALLKDAYQRRDRVSLVTYSGRSAELVLPFTSSVEAAKRYLEKVPFGGTTPMASGILSGLETLLKEVKKEPSAVPIMILVTDGTANSPLHLGGNIRREILQVSRQITQYHVNMLVVDISETGSELAREVARESNGSYYHPRSLSKEALYSAIKQERDSKTAFA